MTSSRSRTTSWDEELKIALMIARNWGATFYKEDDEGLKTCALEDTFVAAMNETIDVRRLFASRGVQRQCVLVRLCAFVSLMIVHVRYLS